jgi:hypothetical protein
MTQPRLPLELLLQILELSYPPGGPNLIADVTSDEAQQLVSWAKVCRATFEPATRFLRQHCVHLDTADRLSKFLQSLRASKNPIATTLPPVVPLTETSSIFIGLEKEDLQIIQNAAVVRDVFIELGASVRRLILDLAFRRMSNGRLNMSTNDVLSEGLAALTDLEDFVTSGGLPALEFWGFDREDLDGNVDGPVPLALRWPKLKRLGAFQVMLSDPGLWLNVAQSHTIEAFVVARPYLLRIQHFNIKQAVSENWTVESGGDPSYARPLSIRLVNHEFSPPLLETTDWALHDPAGLVDISLFDVPIVAEGIKRTDYACREWLMEAAKEGNLWNWQRSNVAKE